VAKAYPSIATLPESTLAEIARLAEGNPYFMEEVVKGLTQSATAQGIAPDPAQVHSLAHKLPDTLHATLQARLDALSTPARSVALLASVVGRVFWVGAITAAAQQTLARGTGLLSTAGAKPLPESVISDGLAELVRAELAFPRAGSMFFGEQEYIFKHSLMRDVAYSLLPHKYRRQYHLGVARWLATYATPDLAATIAEHFEQAGMYAEAAGQFDRAATSARSHGALSEAEALEARARELRAVPPGATRPLTSSGTPGGTGLLSGPT
jgi:predicted ATPase